MTEDEDAVSGRPDHSKRSDNPTRASRASRATERSAGDILRRSGGSTSDPLLGRGVRPPRPPKTCDAGTFEGWLRSQTQRFDPVMSWLGAVFALLVGFLLIARPPGTEGAVLQILSWLIWGVFALDYAARFLVAPDRLRFVRGNWLAAVMLLVPTLRVLRLAALARLGQALPAARIVSSSFHAAGTARTLLRSRLGYLAGLSSLAVIAVAETAYLFGHPRTFRSFADCLVWTLAVVVGQQGDPVPATLPGRLVMVAGFAVGVVLIASLAGMIGSFLLENRKERAAEDDGMATG